MRKGIEKLEREAAEEEEEERSAVAACFKILGVDGKADRINRMRLFVDGFFLFNLIKM